MSTPGWMAGWMKKIIAKAESLDLTSLTSNVLSFSLACIKGLSSIPASLLSMDAQRLSVEIKKFTIRNGATKVLLKKLRRIRYANMTEDEKKEELARQRQRYANLPEDEKEFYNSKRRQRFANLPEDEKEKKRAKDRQNVANWPHAKRDAKNEKNRQRNANLTKEQRDVVNAKQTQRRKNKTKVNKSNPKDLMPQAKLDSFLKPGTSRPGNSRLGNSRPADSRPGTSRPAVSRSSKSTQLEE